MGPYCSALLLLFRPINRKKIQGRRPRTNVSKIEIRYHNKNMRTDSETVSQTERQTDTLINKQTKQTQDIFFCKLGGNCYLGSETQTKVVIAVFSHRSDPLSTKMIIKENYFFILSDTRSERAITTFWSKSQHNKRSRPKTYSSIKSTWTIRSLIPTSRLYNSVKT